MNYLSYDSITLVNEQQHFLVKLELLYDFVLNGVTNHSVDLSFKV